MSPGERAAIGRREPPRPQYGATAPGYPPAYYQPYGMHHPNAWLGAPLISMAGRTRPTPISKLALHAQGAPLIIQNRFDRRKFSNAPETPAVDNGRSRPQPQNRTPRANKNHNNDAVSVTSDESSSSNNSETMLPRIIKPRKRRKKDRKPNNIVSHELSAAGLDIGDLDPCSVPPLCNSSQSLFSDGYGNGKTHMPYRLDVKVFDYPDNGCYGVTALGEALEATRFGLAEAVSPSESASSTCQCRYCDPVGQIWDADSIADLLDENSSDFAPTKLEDSMKVVGAVGRRGADTTLRRSWSDPSSRVPERNTLTENENTSAPNLYSLFPPSRCSNTSQEQSPTLALEISSEIVTSMNGLRDLEIKLFSTSPPASANTERRSFFADKSESADNRCANNGMRSVNSVVDRDGAKIGINNDKQNSQDVSEVACSSMFAAGDSSRNHCDLALVTV